MVAAATGRAGRVLAPALGGALIALGAYLLTSASAADPIPHADGRAASIGAASAPTTKPADGSTPGLDCGPAGRREAAALCRLISTHRASTRAPLWTRGVGGLDGVR